MMEPPQSFEWSGDETGNGSYRILRNKFIESWFCYFIGRWWKMNFSEQLDKFVERGAEKYANIVNNDRDPDRFLLTTENIYENGANSLKPIVLKLVEALEIIGKKEWVQGSSVKLICTETLDEVQQMIGGGKC